ncbi:unnamed protein product [Hermetia illucens]|uniref:Retrotransposon gag domain-containing protein n=1 Tax=Hermetia illucens TaxID=343691 RepID=A0A7R8UEH1_HERIL|nr:unnamed protein product [Hermetia illucens]
MKYRVKRGKLKTKLSVDEIFEDKYRETLLIKLGRKYVTFDLFRNFVFKQSEEKRKGQFVDNSDSDSELSDTITCKSELIPVLEDLMLDQNSSSEMATSSTETVGYNVSFNDLKSFIPVFEGKADDAFNFIYACEEAMSLARGALQTLLFKYICTQLRGNAQTIILNEEFGNWDALKAKLKQVYAESHSMLHLQRELFSFKQYNSETVVQYHQRLLGLHRRILTSRSDSSKRGENAFLEEQVLTVFINGLKQELTMYVITQKPKTLEEASRLAQEEEQRKEDGGNNCMPSQSQNNEYRVNSLDIEESPYLFLNFEGRFLKLLIDTGSSLNVIAAKFVFEHQVDKSEFTNYKCINAIDGTTFGSTVVSLSYINNEFRIPFQVATNRLFDKFDGILGAPFLVEHKALLDLENYTLKLGKSILRLTRRTFSAKPRAETLHYLHVNAQPGENLLVSGLQEGNLSVADMLVQVDNNCEIPILILNKDNNETKLNTDDLIICNIRQEELNVKEIKVKIRDDHMNSEEKESIWEILREYACLFNEIDPDQLTKAAEHTIDTIPGTKPIHTKIYRFPKIHEQELTEIDEEIEDDLSQREGNEDNGMPPKLTPEIDIGPRTYRDDENPPELLPEVNRNPKNYELDDEQNCPDLDPEI